MKAQRPIQVEVRAARSTGTSPDAWILGGLLGPMFAGLEQEQNRLSARESVQRLDDAAKSDVELDVVPLQGTFGITALIRHARLQTGFSFEDLGRIAGAEPGIFTQLAAGTRDVGEGFGSYHGGGLVDFVNLSRRFAASYPKGDVRAWWEERRPRKRLSPLELIVAGRQWDKIFGQYREELTVDPTSHVWCTGSGMVEVDFFWPYAPD